MTSGCAETEKIQKNNQRWSSVARHGGGSHRSELLLPP